MAPATRGSTATSRSAATRSSPSAACRAGKAKREIDAKGLVVAPGFIDMHSHSDDLLLEDGNAQSKIRQGVTTEVLGEGRSAGPLQGASSRPRTFKARGKEFTWATLGGYFDALDKAGVTVNVASYVGLDNVWECVMGKSHDAAHARSSSTR